MRQRTAVDQRAGARVDAIHRVDQLDIAVGADSPGRVRRREAVVEYPVPSDIDGSMRTQLVLPDALTGASRGQRFGPDVCGRIGHEIAEPPRRDLGDRGGERDCRGGAARGVRRRERERQHRRGEQGHSHSFHACSLPPFSGEAPREALQNVTKYATATGATVHLYREDSHLAFQVIDDGVGFDANAKGHGTGIQGMACRCHRVGPLDRARLR